MIRSIRTKLFVFLIVLMVAYALLGIILNLFFLKPYYMQQNEVYFKNAVLNLQEIDSTQNINEEIRNIGHDTGMFLAITDRKFKILHSSNNINGQLLSPDVISALVEEGKGQKKIYTVSDQKEPIPKLIYMEQLDNDRRAVLTKSISVIDESVAIANHFYLVTGFFMLIVGGIAVFIFSKTLTNPIIEMSKIARNISELNFEKHVGIYSKDELGNLAQSINILSDNLKISMERLKKDISFQKNLSRNISHELKTPVAVIKGHAEGLIYSVVDTPEEQRRYLNIIVNECDRMNVLVNEMLMLSRLSVYDKNEVMYEIFDADIICRHIESRFSPIFQKKKIQFICKGANGIKIKGNRNLIETAVSNYISNAVKYGTGEIVLSFEEGETKTIISVFNTGENIPQEELDHIFEPFYKLNYARKNNEEGHGLGLSIVHSIAEIHDAKAYAENYDKGVVFTLEIPLE